MRSRKGLDGLVRARLREWPQRPPGLHASLVHGPEQLPGHDGAWLRGRPGGRGRLAHPFLKLPGSTHMRTLPDGLWLKFGGRGTDAFVDIFAIEACATLSNLLDKRSRFAPSTQSLLAVCPRRWLMEPVAPAEPRLRWQGTGILKAPPEDDLILPVRDLRVMYALRTSHYRGFAVNQVPHPHEYFVPMDALTARAGHESPSMQAIVARAALSSNFMAL